ncbi:hypothetical protein EB235_20200 [Mesorhizobium loti R88b]|uniref:Uncharacterized protein n=1 Tax=Mesorhizobium loti R88b TaxID=935548 RepID=A0A6M7WRN3_RHILI|nr:hypothetical protein EB235_20200 [Mesorhizobium loti R88b]
MSYEPIKVAEGMTPAPREYHRIENHICEHYGCVKSAPFGYAKPKKPAHWFCLTHRSDGDQYLGSGNV